MGTKIDNLKRMVGIEPNGRLVLKNLKEIKLNYIGLINHLSIELDL